MGRSHKRFYLLANKIYFIIFPLIWTIMYDRSIPIPTLIITLLNNVTLLIKITLLRIRIITLLLNFKGGERKWKNTCDDDEDDVTGPCWWSTSRWKDLLLSLPTGFFCFLSHHAFSFYPTHCFSCCIQTAWTAGRGYHDYN